MARSKSGHDIELLMLKDSQPSTTYGLSARKVDLLHPDSVLVMNSIYCDEVAGILRTLGVGVDILVA